MKISIFVLLILILVLFFEIRSSFCQEKYIVENFIINLTIPDGELGTFKETLKFNSSHSFTKNPVGGSFATVDCRRCPLTSRYDFLVYEAKKIDDNHFKVGVVAKFYNKKGCNAQKEFIVTRNQSKKVNLKCGVSLVANYDFELETKEN